MKIERIVCERGWQTLFYVTKTGMAIDPPPRVSCHSPIGVKKIFDKLRHVEVGIYSFDYYFDKPGKHVFVCYEGNEATMIMIANANLLYGGIHFA